MYDRDAVSKALQIGMSEAGLGITELAAKADVNVKTLRSARRGERDVQEANRSKISRALGWEPDWLTQIAENGFTLERLQAIRAARAGGVALRDPTKHTLADSTDPELVAEVGRRGLTNRSASA